MPLGDYKGRMTRGGLGGVFENVMNPSVGPGTLETSNNNNNNNKC